MKEYVFYRDNDSDSQIIDKFLSKVLKCNQVPMSANNAIWFYNHTRPNPFCYNQFIYGFVENQNQYNINSYQYILKNLSNNHFSE